MSNPSPPSPPLDPSTEPFETEPATEPLAAASIPRPAPAPPGPSRRKRHRAIVVATTIGAVLVLGVAAAVGYWSGDDHGADVTTEPSTTIAPSTSAGSSTVTTEQPTTTGATTTSTVTTPPVDTTTAIFPYGSGTARYDDPIAAARGFAVDFAGFAQPVIGEFQQGDTRSGEIEVRPTAEGPATVLFVRQLDDTWWILGAVTENLSPVLPVMGAPITSPVTVSGTAVGFEGKVDVQVRQDGSTAPLGRGSVTGSGAPPAGPFHGQISFTPPTEEYGAMVFTVNSARNGEVWQVAAYRIRFA